MNLSQQKYMVLHQTIVAILEDSTSPFIVERETNVDGSMSLVFLKDHGVHRAVLITYVPETELFHIADRNPGIKSVTISNHPSAIIAVCTR